MSSIEPAVAVKNLLYNQWKATPAKDTTKADTLDPTKVHFTNRRFAPTPVRTHTYHVSVVANVKNYIPYKLGTVTNYRVNEMLTIHIWVLTGPKQSVETALKDFYSLQTEVRRIIRNLGETAGSGIQHILLGPWRDKSELDKDPVRLHVEGVVTPILFETS